MLRKLNEAITAAHPSCGMIPLWERLPEVGLRPTVPTGRGSLGSGGSLLRMTDL